MKSMKTALPVLIALAAPLAAQSPSIQGGGEVVIAGAAYRFEPASLMASTQPVNGNQMLRIRGRLVPADAAGALDFELVAMGDHEIYLLKLTGNGIRWNANLKTKVEVTAPQEPKDGDRATFQVSGPLVRLEGSKEKRTIWSGAFWSAFTVEQAP